MPDRLLYILLLVVVARAANKFDRDDENDVDCNGEDECRSNRRQGREPSGEHGRESSGEEDREPSGEYGSFPRQNPGRPNAISIPVPVLVPGIPQLLPKPNPAYPNPPRLPFAIPIYPPRSVLYPTPQYPCSPGGLNPCQTTQAPCTPGGIGPCQNTYCPQGPQGVCYYCPQGPQMPCYYCPQGLHGLCYYCPYGPQGQCYYCPQGIYAPCHPYVYPTAPPTHPPTPPTPRPTSRPPHKTEFTFTEAGVILSYEYPQETDYLYLNWVYNLHASKGLYIKVRVEEVWLDAGRIEIYSCGGTRVGSCTHIEEFTVASDRVVIKVVGARRGKYRISWSTYGGCPAGWHQFENNCYLYSGSNMNHDSAQAFCRSGGFINAGLASILSWQEQNAINRYAPTSGVYHIGLIKTPSGWMWQDGSGGIAGYSNWQNLEPDGIGYDMKSASCTQGNYGSGGKWDDINCDQRLPVLCKLRLFTCIRGY